MVINHLKQIYNYSRWNSVIFCKEFHYTCHNRFINNGKNHGLYNILYPISMNGLIKIHYMNFNYFVSTKIHTIYTIYKSGCEI